MLAVSQTDEAGSHRSSVPVFLDPLAADRGSVPIPTQTAPWGNKRSNQRACPLASMPMRILISPFLVEVFGLFLGFQALLAEFALGGVHIRTLLEVRLIAATYNDHVPFSRAFVGLAPKFTCGQGSEHCYGIIALVWTHSIGREFLR